MLDPKLTEDKPPRGKDGKHIPHLALVTERGMMALKPGNVIAIVEDPTKPDGIFLLAIHEVSHKKLVFVAYTQDRSSSRHVVFKADWRGDYKSWLRKGNTKTVTTTDQAKAITKQAADDYDPTEYL